jgi:NADPH:quinone reductase-like Zn-dependent oxidoreductase
MTQTMRAVRLHEIGGPQNLRVDDDVAVPQPAAGEVLVRIRAAAFNHRDVFITQGRYPGITLPVIPGSDGAGEVAALGDGVTHLKAGDEVVIDPMLDWGSDPHVWDPNASSIVGMPHPGTFAQYVAVPAHNVHAKPRSLTMEEAAAIPLAGLTAYRATFTRGALKPGETVLITGVGGGVQTFVLLFAKQTGIGARAVVTSGSDEKLARARELGADVTLNYKTTPDWPKQARAAGPIDLFVDSTGGETLAKGITAVRPGGRVAIYGGTTGDATIRPWDVFWKHLTILGTSMGSPDDFKGMLSLFETGGLTPVVDRVFAMDDVVAAAERMAAADQFGKIVLRID